MLFLKQSTTINIKIGPFVDSVDGYTAKTGLSPTVKLSKNGGNIGTRNSATATAHDADGYYTVELDTTDTGTLGRLQVSVAGSSTSLPVWQEYMVVTANIWDSLCSTDVFDVSVTQWTGTNVASPDTAGYPKVTHKSGTGTGELNISSGVVDANVTKFGGTNGTFASGRPETNTTHIAGSSVSTSSAQIGVNVVNAGGTAWGSGAITAGSINTGAITSAKFAAGAIDAAAIATGAVDADALATDAVSEIADGILSRNVSNVEASAGEHTLCTIVLAMLENSIGGTTLTIKRTDGVTTHATKTLTTSATAEPITGIT